MSPSSRRKSACPPSAFQFQGHQRLAVLATACLLGCSVPVATNLEEEAANRLVAALDRSGVAAEKQAQDGDEGRFVVDVGRADALFALSVMAREGLPARRAPGLREALGEGHLLPSRSEEGQRWLLGTAGELQTSLEALSGVVSARVHLAAAKVDPLNPRADRSPASASVLIRYRGSSSPLAEAEIQRLVAGAVGGLQPHAVSVVSQALGPEPARSDNELVRVGPLTTTRASLPYLEWLIVIGALLNLGLAALLGGLWWRGRSKMSSA